MFQFARVIGLVLLVAALPQSALSQTSYITGTVTDAVNSAPLASVRVDLTTGAGASAGSAITNDAGQFRIANVAPGTYTLSFMRLGYAAVRVPGVQVASGIPVIQGAEMTRSILQFNPTVISISRTPEKALDAPASVFVIDARQVAERPNLTVADHLKGVPGLDVNRGGLVQSNIVARGFNNAFSGAMLMLVDNRFASVPSLRVNVPALFTVTNNDVDHIETVLGPAAALYGPNSANGVLAIFTKSAFDEHGTTLSLEAGDRGIFKGGLRTATVIADRLGLKFSLEKMTGTDFHFHDPAETGTGLRPPAPGEQRVPTPISRDYKVDRTAGELRVDYHGGPDTEFIASYGLSQLGNGIELTSPSGAVQGHNWTYSHVQFRARHKGLFAQAFANFSDAGNEDSLDTRGTFFLRTGNPIVDNSRIHAFQVQQKWDVTAREQLIFGVDYIKTDPQTKGTINGRNESDDNVTEYGAYVHSLTHLAPKFDLVAAVRADYQSVVDDQLIAPRVGIVFKPTESHNLRLTYNRAQFTPANFAFFLDFQLQRLNPQLPYFVRALGNKNGFTYRRDCAQGTQGLCMKSPFNTTPGTFVNAGGTDLFRAGLAVATGPQIQAALVQAIGPAQTAQAMQIMAGLTPTDAQIGGRLQVAVPSVGFQPITTTWNDFAALEPERYDVVELGYKGIFGTRAHLAADLWFQRRHNFTGPASNISPNVFITAGALGPYLVSQLTPSLGAASAAAVGAILSQGLAPVPLGTVVPDHEFATSPDVLFSYYQVRDDVDLYGLDLAFDYLLSSRISVSGTYSWVNEDFFPDVFGAGIEPLSLNAPDNKASLAFAFRDDRRGFSAELRGRYANTFPVSSGVYQGTTPVNAFLDVSTTYRLPGQRNMLVTVLVNNVLDNDKPTFVGVPSLGRLAIARFQVTF